MSKKGKKNKWKNLPSEFKTCIIGMIIFLTVGLGLVLYGMLFAGIRSGDLRTVSAEVTSIDKVSRNLDSETAESLRDDGEDVESVKYEFEVGYRYTVEGKEYSYTARKSFGEGSSMSVGDTEDLKYAMKNGKPVINPDTDFTYVFVGIILIVIGAIAGLAAYILRPKKNKKQQNREQQN